MEGKGLTPLFDIARNKSRIKNPIATAFAAEFLGTFILCLFGVGAGCQAIVTGISVGLPLIGGIIGLMVAIIIVGGASGGHINPSVTLGVAICGGISWMLVPIYWAAQFLGAYVGSGVAWALYKSKLERMCSGDLSTCKDFAGAFAPIPQDDVGIALVDQIVGTSLLVGVIIASVDQRNMKIPSYCFPPFFAVTILGINCALGVNAGGVLNPARDLGARLMAITVGYSADDVFISQPEDNHYWLAPFFGPLLGGALAAVVYIYVIGAHLADGDDADEDLKTRRYKVSSSAIHDYE